MNGENKMGTMPVGKLLITMSLPMIASMLVQALYNIVDSIFVAHYSQAALAAISYSFPAQNLMIGLATGIGVGMNALLSRSLGEKNYERVNKAAENGLFLAFLSFIAFFIFGMFFAGSFIRFQTKTEEIIGYGKTYLMICSCASFGIFGEITFERLMQSTGRTVLSMITQGCGAIINIILDPIFIFGYFGLPEMGIAGAALATVTGQIIAFGIAIVLNHKYNKEIRINLRSFRPDKKIIGRICAVGVPSVIMMCIGSVMTTSMNKILNGFSDVATSVFGVYYKLQSFVFMPIFGLNNGLVPIIAYNYGAKKRKRLLGALKTACLIAICFMALGLVLMQIFPEPLLRLFDAEEEMLAIGSVALRIISLSFTFAGVCIVTGSTFQALGFGTYTMFTSICRQLVVLLPAAYLFSLSGNLNLVWWAFPLAEIMSVLVTAIMFIKVNKNVISKIPE